MRNTTYILVSKPANAKLGKDLFPERKDELIELLKQRFEENVIRHNGIIWKKVQARLEANEEKIWSLNEMERTGGEPDVVSHDEITDKYVFYDCSPESPGQWWRDSHKPDNGIRQPGLSRPGAASIPLRDRGAHCRHDR